MMLTPFGAPALPFGPLHAPAEAGRGGAHPFALPSAMRARLAAAVKAGPIAVIDVGTTKIACAILEAGARRGGADGQGGDPLRSVTLRGVGHNRARGLDMGAITDLAAAEAAIRAAVTQAERDAGMRAYQAVAALSGGYPRSQAAGAEIELSGGPVSAKNIAAAVNACRPPPQEEGRRILDVAPVRWTLDGEAGIRSPLGLSGKRLGVDLHVLSVAEAAVRNLAHCLARADLEVAGFVSGPCASGLGALTEDEREDGAAVVDLGGGATTVALFLRGAFVFADLIRLGGEQITLDLVRAFDLPKAEAERLKVLEGSAVDLSAGAPPIDMATVAPSFGGRGRRSAGLSRADLAGAIRPRIVETLALARDRLAQAGFSYLPRRRVVLTGGGAELGGLLETAQEVFGPAVRIGLPAHPEGAPISLAGPAFAALAGLARHVADPPPPLQGPSAPRAASGGVSGLFRWLRETW